jgi:hypothetical protein
MLFVLWVLTGVGTTGYILWRIIAAYQGMDPSRLPVHKVSAMIKDARPKVEPVIENMKDLFQVSPATEIYDPSKLARVLWDLNTLCHFAMYTEDVIRSKLTVQKD